MNERQFLDFRRAALPHGDYANQYFIGPYGPRGNPFCAYSIKDRVVEWLEPKPITYRKPAPDPVDFRGYLPVSPEGSGAADISKAPMRP